MDKHLENKVLPVELIILIIMINTSIIQELFTSKKKTRFQCRVGVGEFIVAWRERKL